MGSPRAHHQPADDLLIMHVNVHLEIPLGISGYATVILTWVLIVASMVNLSQLQRFMVNEMVASLSSY